MSFPKLNMRHIRRHPSVISNPNALQPEMEVAVCHLLPTVGKTRRCAQALMRFSFPSEGIIDRREGLKKGYNHTPTWGIVVDHIATVNWVNDTNPQYAHPYASLKVTQSNSGLSLAESLDNIAHSVDELITAFPKLPKIEDYDYSSDTLISEREVIFGFKSLGLVLDEYDLDKFVIDLSKLSSDSHSEVVIQA